MTRIALLMGVVLVVGCQSPAKAGGVCGEGDYCPGCKTFCGAECPKTEQGVCKACGKAPAQVNACEQAWFWCKTHAVWHGEPCAENAASKCCEKSKTSVAICLPADAKNVESATYCPECRCFCGTECPLDASGKCKKCGKAPVKVEALAGAWHWCAQHKRWHADQPCADHAAQKCCTEARAKILVCRP